MRTATGARKVGPDDTDELRESGCAGPKIFYGDNDRPESLLWELGRMHQRQGWYSSFPRRPRRRSQCLPVVWHISPHFLVQSAWETAHPAPALPYFAKLDPCDFNPGMLQYHAHKQGGVACQVAPPPWKYGRASGAGRRLWRRDCPMFGTYRPVRRLRRRSESGFPFPGAFGAVFWFSPPARAAPFCIFGPHWVAVVWCCGVVD
eukprot:gene24135-biopygen8918